MKFPKKIIYGILTNYCLFNLFTMIMVAFMWAYEKVASENQTRMVDVDRGYFHRIRCL